MRLDSMSTFTAYAAVDMSKPVVIKGTYPYFTSPATQVILQNLAKPGVTEIFTGDLTRTIVSGKYSISGLISKIEVFRPYPEIIYSIEISDYYRDATIIQSALSGGSPLAAEAYIFTQNDTIIGSSENDYLAGFTGDDDLRGAEGNDTIDGGDGQDTAIYLGFYATTRITVNSNGGYTISNGVDGTDTITNVETLVFVDKKVSLASFTPITSKWSELANNQAITFDPSKDTLSFDDASISASNLSLSILTSLFDFGSPALENVTITYGGKTITLSLYGGARALTTANVTFANGSQLVIGDNSPYAIPDNSDNTLNGTAQGDLLIGLGGNDNRKSVV